MTSARRFARRACTTPSTSARSRSRRSPTTWSSSARGTERPWRPAWAGWSGGGTLVLVGNGIDPPRFDPNRILLNELTVTGSFVYDAGGFEAALDLLASGRLPLDELVEPDDVDLDGLLPAMRGLAEGRIARKVLVAP